MGEQQKEQIKIENRMKQGVITQTHITQCTGADM
jgi:hypothetical protein